MLISVVIPTFNRMPVLLRAIDSVLSQKGVSIVGAAMSDSLAVESSDQFKSAFNVELIVVDDGSTDDTSDYIREHYPQVRLIKQSNKGVSAARNAAIKHSEGDWIALLDSDDQWMPDKLITQLDAIKKTGLKVCHTQEVWIRDGVRVNQMKKHQKFGGAIFTKCLPLCAMSPSSIIIHKSVFESVGTFDEAFPACEDYDLWLRITATHQVAYIEEPLIYKYGGHDDQLSRQYWGMDRFRVLALHKLLSDDFYLNALSHEELEAALKILLKKLKILLKGAIKHENHTVIEDCNNKISHWQAYSDARSI